MASNFEISNLKNSDGLCLGLDGDFDATSAYELIYAIKKLPDDVVKIYVNTNGLKKIQPSGLDVFNGFMDSLDGRSARIILTGHNASQLSLGNPSSNSKISNFFLKELLCPNV
jgi:ABC-type transporter Mla MlaB component